MRYPYQFDIIVTNAAYAAAKPQIESFCRKGSFTLPAQPVSLAPSAGAAGTHVGTQLILTQKMKDDFDTLKSNLVSVFWFLVDNSNSLLLLTSSNVVGAPTGSPWTFNDCVSQVGLVRI